MGIFDFFRKKKTESGIEIVNLSNIREFLSIKRQEIEEKQNPLKDSIRSSINELVNALESQVEVLKHISLDERKVMQMERLIVMQNLNNFIQHLERLIEKLQVVDSESYEKLVDNINDVFSDFEKKSFASFQKSTYLIGEELGNIRESISKFFKFFNELVRENKFLIEKMSIIASIKEDLSSVESVKNAENENETQILGIEEKIKELEKSIHEQKIEIADIKKSQEYNNQIRARQDLERLKTKFAIELQKLKEMIDFKTLAKIYHSAEKQMALIRDYRDNFKGAIDEYGLKKVLELTNIKEINQEPIKEKINFINEIKEKIYNIKIEKDITEDLEANINHTRKKIRDLNSEKTKKIAIAKKFQENQEQIKKQISNKLTNFKVILE